MAKHGFKQLIQALKRSKLDKSKDSNPETFTEIAEYLDICLGTVATTLHTEQMILYLYRPDLECVGDTNDPICDHEKVRAYLRREAGFKLMMHDENEDARRLERRDVTFWVYWITAEMLSGLKEHSDCGPGKQMVFDKLVAINTTAHCMYKSEWM